MNKRLEFYIPVLFVLQQAGMVISTAWVGKTTAVIGQWSWKTVYLQSYAKGQPTTHHKRAMVLYKSVQPHEL